MEQTLAPTPRFIHNPDVVLREVDEDGGLIFNPDTNQVRVLNTTGFFIWGLCDGTHDLQGLITAMHAEFDQVPPDQVTDQVKIFMDDMIASGFIGTLEGDPTGSA